MSKLFISPADRAEHERKKVEWGESGPTIFVAQDRVIGEAVDRTNIELNHKGYVPKNQTEQQKQRTFVQDGS